MIDEDTKHKFLKELAKSGNVYIASMKIGIHRDSHYRWKKEDKEYAKQATLAEKRGRENNCDVAEHALMINVKEKKMDAIKYVLSHNSPKYRIKRDSKVILEHRTNKVDKAQITFEDILEMRQNTEHEHHQGYIEATEKGKIMAELNWKPVKPNGEVIYPWEEEEWKEYIQDARKKRKQEQSRPASEETKDSSGAPEEELL